MMNKMNKRIYANIIDGLIIAFLLAFCGISHLPSWVWSISFDIGRVPVTLPSFGSPFIVAIIVFRDFIYGNAGIGKKAMGIIIVDENWMKPSFKIMLKRGFIMLFVEPVLCFCSKTNGTDIDVWEFEKVKTRVIEKELYDKMKRECETKRGDYKENMDDCYNNYILGKYE